MDGHTTSVEAAHRISQAETEQRVEMGREEQVDQIPEKRRERE